MKKRVYAQCEVSGESSLTHIMGCQCDDVLAGEEQTYLEEERNRILARVDDLKHRVCELERQLQETKQEVDTHIHTLTHTVTLAEAPYTHTSALILSSFHLSVIVFESLLFSHWSFQFLSV